MNKPFLSLILILGALYFFPKEQSSHSDPFEGIPVCHSPSDDMAQFVNATGFASFHPSPISFEFGGKGEMVSFPTGDGMTANGYLITASTSSDKWLFVYQEWWGLNDNIKQQAELFYDDLEGKVNVLAIDMYDGKVTANPQKAGKLMQSVKEERLEYIVIGARKMAGSTEQIANVGWCFGRSWSLKSALLKGQQNLGAVMYYGMPVRDVEKLKTLNPDYALGSVMRAKNAIKSSI
jgi:carboxymethylenebutenolidase